MSLLIERSSQTATPTNTPQEPSTPTKRSTINEKIIFVIDSNSLSAHETETRIKTLFTDAVETIITSSLTLTYEEIAHRKPNSLDKVTVFTLTNSPDDSEESQEAETWIKTNSFAQLQFTKIKGDNVLTSSEMFAKFCCEETTGKSSSAAISSSKKAKEFELPCLDMLDYYSEDPTVKQRFLINFREAAIKHGFISFKNVGIDSSIIANAYKLCKTFFALPFPIKDLANGRDIGNQRGYTFGEQAKGAVKSDKKEFIHTGKEGYIPSEDLPNILENRWLPLRNYKEAIMNMRGAVEEYMNILLTATAEAINLGVKEGGEKLDPTHFTSKLGQGENNLLRSLNYPPVSAEDIQDPNNPPMGAAPHTDIDYITVLPEATALGLQVYAENEDGTGEWVNATAPKDAFIVNFGDMLTHATNGLIKSSRHRVLAGERQSQVFFVHPTGSTSLKPHPVCIEQTGGRQLYSDCTRDELLFERLLELFGKIPGIYEYYIQSGHLERQMEYGKESAQVYQMLLDNGYVLGSKKVPEEKEGGNKA